MNIVLCESAEKREYTAGNKARTDSVAILRREGFRHVSLYRSKSAKPLILLQMGMALLKTFFYADKNDTVFIQYPYYPASVNRVLFWLLAAGRRIKRYTITVLIHDSTGLRNETESSDVLRKEVRLLEKADTVITHNERMSQAFKAAGGRKKYTELGPFDYLYDGPLASGAYSAVPTICIAGNLSKEKCGYVYKLDRLTNCRFNLYGIGYTGAGAGNTLYKGVFAPDELISHMEGAFGLVWDGDSTETCTGVYGQYLRYNNPHKFSLYIAAGIPVIVWRESAAAAFVEKYAIGLCVSSLQELDTVLPALDEREYRKIAANVMRYREDIISGSHLKETLHADKFA